MYGFRCSITYNLHFAALELLVSCYEGYLVPINYKVWVRFEPIKIIIFIAEYNDFVFLRITLKL